MGHELDDRNEVEQRPRRRGAAPAAVERGEPGFEQQLVGDRRRPRGLDDLLAVVPDVARLGRAVVEAAVQRNPVVTTIAALLAALLVGRPGAVLLIVLVE